MIHRPRPRLVLLFAGGVVVGCILGDALRSIINLR